jgi:hypothetical protein
MFGEEASSFVSHHPMNAPDVLRYLLLAPVYYAWTRRPKASVRH